MNLGVYRLKDWRTQEKEDEKDYMCHIQRKDAARVKKIKNNENNQHVYLMNFMSVLYSISKASTIYYKQKLVEHNFTIYNALCGTRLTDK